jgi:CheY-like chemotaxis protein
MGASSGSRGVVLVVEDEPLVRMVAAATIEDAGFETIEAVGAESAIAILEVRQDIRIVFADIQMPGSMDGLKLARVVRDRWPPIELILTSGVMKIGQRDLPERSVFLAKPYSLDALTTALSRFDDGP